MRNSSGIFYTAINTLVFCFFVTAAVGMFKLMSNLMTTKADVTRDRTTLYVVEPETDIEDSPIDVYMGRKSYSPASGDSYVTPSSLTGDNFVITGNEEIVTAASVFTELMSLPDTVITVYVNGTSVTSNKIRKWIKNGETYKLYELVEASNKNKTYKRTYYDAAGQLIGPNYNGDIAIIRYEINHDTKASG